MVCQIFKSLVVVTQVIIASLEVGVSKDSLCYHFLLYNSMDVEELKY